MTLTMFVLGFLIASATYDSLKLLLRYLYILWYRKFKLPTVEKQLEALTKSIYDYYAEKSTDDILKKNLH